MTNFPILPFQVIDGLSDYMCSKIGVNWLQTCQVPHINITHALTMTIREKMPFKMTFSSDTSTCSELVKLGRNSTLLIHEATFPDAYIDSAMTHRHSTLTQAIDQSKAMNAKFTILTHFSRRFNQIPFVDSAKHKNIGIAFDFMELTENDLPKLSKLNKSYQNLFNVHQ